MHKSISVKRILKYRLNFNYIPESHFIHTFEFKLNLEYMV